MAIDKKQAAIYEAYLTILVILAFLIAGILQMRNAQPSLYFLSFLIFLGAFLFLERNVRPRPKPNPRDIPLGSFSGNFNFRMKNRTAGKVVVTFQWPERADSEYVHRRIGLKTSAAIAEHFSHLTALPAYSDLRSYILDSLKTELQSLRVQGFDVLIHDIEIKEPPRDDNNPDVIVGVIIPR